MATASLPSLQCGYMLFQCLATEKWKNLFFSSFGVLGSKGHGKAEPVQALASRPCFDPLVECSGPQVGKPWLATLALGIQKRLRLASQLPLSRDQQSLAWSRIARGYCKW